MFAQEWKYVPAMTSDDTAQSSPEFWRIYGKPAGNPPKKRIRIRSVEYRRLRSGMTSVYAQRSCKQVKRMLEISSWNSGLFRDFNLPLFQMKSPGGRKPDLQLKFFQRWFCFSQFEERCRQWGAVANDISTRFFLTFLYFYRRFIHYFYTSVGKLISWSVLFSSPWTPHKA